MANFDDMFNSKQENNKPTSFNRDEWMHEKQAQRENAYKLIDETAKKLSQDGKTFQKYLDVQSRLDRYSVGNVLLITAQKPDAIRLADSKGWKENEAFIKKGEKGIIILEPGEEYKRDNGSVGVSYNAKKVFDITQTTAKQNTGPTIKKDDRLLLKALLNNAPVPINIGDNLPENVRAEYFPEKKEIRVRQGMDSSDIFKALSQEIAHATMDKGNYNPESNIFVAYCVSYILCKRNGIDVSSFNFDKLPSNFISMDAKDIRAELSKIRDVANEISSNMAQVLEPKKPKNKDDKSR